MLDYYDGLGYPNYQGKGYTWMILTRHALGALLSIVLALDPTLILKI